MGQHVSPKKEPGLSTVEDQELRQLTWFARVGNLSERATARLWELSRRDRRHEVRDVRPNPSADPEDEPGVGRLPDLDRVSAMTCPNCGVILPGQARTNR